MIWSFDQFLLSFQELDGFSCVNPYRDSPNGYPTVSPTELQPVTLAH